MADTRTLAMLPVHVDARALDGAVVELSVAPDGIVYAEMRIPAPAVA